MVNAQLLVGEALHFGNGVAKDLEKAVTWYEKAATQGNEVASQRLDAIKRAAS
jgi:TPR repeat protein